MWEGGDRLVPKITYKKSLLCLTLSPKSLRYLLLGQLFLLLCHSLLPFRYLCVKVLAIQIVLHDLLETLREYFLDVLGQRTIKVSVQ